MTGEDELKTYSFRAEKEKVEYLDWLIQKKNVNAGPGSDESVSRSDILRGCIEEHIEELEEELDMGNPKSPAVATAD